MNINLKVLYNKICRIICMTLFSCLSLTGMVGLTFHASSCSHFTVTVFYVPYFFLNR